MTDALQLCFNSYRKQLPKMITSILFILLRFLVSIYAFISTQIENLIHFYLFIYLNHINRILNFMQDYGDVCINIFMLIVAYPSFWLLVPLVK